MALSRFIEVSELNNIRFKTLKNTILIKNSQVIIPVMDIQSNALNLSASGTHDFNNQYDYRLKLKLSELLYSKARSAGRSEFEIARDESDTRTLFLKIYDNGSGSTVEMDREETARKIREDLKNEKTELKKILNEELGLFKHDEEVILENNRQEGEEEIFRFDFSEESDTDPAANEIKERGKWRRKRSKSDSLQNKPASGFVIDE